MARIKLEFPDKTLFSTTIPIRIGDMNYGGHLGNDAALALVHEARMQFLKAHGASELDLFGPGIIMTDAAITYQAEVFYGEEVRVEVAAGDVGSKSFELYYRITSGDKTALTVKTGFVCYDYKLKKVQSVPDVFLEILRGEG